MSKSINQFVRVGIRCVLVVCLFVSSNSLNVNAQEPEYLGAAVRSDPTLDGLFGFTMDVAGTLLAVGSLTNDFRTGPGSVYVYDFSDPDNITETRLLNPNDTGDLESFGRSVAVSGNSVFVGAANENNGAGVVYQFDLTDRNNISHRAITAFDATTNGRFGQSLAVDDDTLLVGAPDVSASIGLPPAAYVLDISDLDSITQRKIVLDPDDNVGRFGEFIDISGDHVVIGEPEFVRPSQPGLPSRVGAVHLFDLTDSDSEILANALTLTGDPTTTRFGEELAIHGDKILVGSPASLIPGRTGRGTAYLFDVSDPNDIRRFQLESDEPNRLDRLGDAVDIFGDIAIVGTGSSNPRVLGFDVSDLSDIKQIFDLSAPESISGFGRIVRINDNTLAVGSQSSGLQSTTPPGSAFIYDVAVPEPSSWVLLSIFGVIGIMRRQRIGGNQVT